LNLRQKSIECLRNSKKYGKNLEKKAESNRISGQKGTEGISFYRSQNSEESKFVNGRKVSSEDLSPCALAWRNPSRTCGCTWGLLKVREGKHRWKPESRESVLLFSRFF
jgi:hypothetical protein